MEIPRFGPAMVASPLRSRHFVQPGSRVLVNHDLDAVLKMEREGQALPSYASAGPRDPIFHDPAQTTAAIVTCGGLCPGINDVIRAIFMQLWHGYGVRRILGLKYGFQGLNPACGHEPIRLDPDEVDDIHQQGGSILSSSRGPQDPRIMVDFLVERGINILFTIGGDGTQRGAKAISDEVNRRGLPISIIGVPKSIDNDISCIDQTFGFETAVSEASQAIVSAHNEAKGAPNGVGIVKLMGRHSGFIAAWATLAYSEVNLTLVPEIAFKLHGKGNVLDYVEWRLRNRRHCVIVVAEGAGQDLFGASCGRDASGNNLLQDIGVLLKEEIKTHCSALDMEVSIKYIDPSYMIRGVPATAGDSVYCLRLGQHAAHAGMAGYTDMLVGSWHGHITHVPLHMATAERKLLDPHGWEWQTVLRATGQPDWR